jgi:hypothetical protein
VVLHVDVTVVGILDDGIPRHSGCFLLCSGSLIMWQFTETTGFGIEWSLVGVAAVLIIVPLTGWAIKRRDQ